MLPVSQSTVKVEGADSDSDDIVEVTKKRKVTVTNHDLPVGAHDGNRFRHVYVPSNIWWMAFQPNPFKAEKDPQVSFMRASWKVIYGNTVPHKVRIDDSVFRIVGYQLRYYPTAIFLLNVFSSQVKQRLSDGWRCRFGPIAISVVNAFFESKEVASFFTTDDSRQQFAKTMLKDFRFLYSDTKSSNPEASLTLVQI